MNINNNSNHEEERWEVVWIGRETGWRFSYALTKQSGLPSLRQPKCAAYIIRPVRPAQEKQPTTTPTP